jgi:small-conductance mechanosensitive channel/CRP-like cAMP-binding protein
MAENDLRKRTVFLLLSISIIILVLILIPNETTINTYLANYFGLFLEANGKIKNVDGSMASQVSVTAAMLIINIFRIFKIFLGMAVVIIVVRYVNYLIFHLALRNSAQNEISSLLKTVLSIIVSIVAFFIIFQSQYENVELAPLFTGSTILGIVVGLALQDTLGNLFAGIALQADQPFQLGDVVNIQNKATGVVEAISWRGIKVRTFQNKVIVVSNSVVGKEFIEVAPKDNLNARIVFFNTLYSASPAKTIQLIRDVVRQVENVSPKMRPVVRIRNLGDSGIDWEVKYWLEDYTKYNDTDALIRQRIWYAFQRENIHFAFPTRTLYVENQSLEPDFTESVNEIFMRLSEVEIFAPLNDEETQKLAEKCEAKIFSPNEPIVRKGQEGKSMFVVHRGSVKIQIVENGIPRTVNTLHEGEIFGEMGLFTGEPRSANVVAAEETEVLEIKHTAVKPLFKKNPNLVEALSQTIAERKAMLSSANEEKPEVSVEKEGVFSSIKKFFGLN